MIRRKISTSANGQPYGFVCFQASRYHCLLGRTCGPSYLFHRRVLIIRTHNGLNKRQKSHNYILGPCCVYFFSLARCICKNVTKANVRWEGDTFSGHISDVSQINAESPPPSPNPTVDIDNSKRFAWAQRERQILFVISISISFFS